MWEGYRYGFNGKEKDQSGEFGGNTTYDYGFRIYNPTIGKFLSVDPLTKEYPWYTPYQFAGNKVIMASDKDGLEEELEMVYKSGEKTITKIININQGGVSSIIDSYARAFHKVGTPETHYWIEGYNEFQEIFNVYKGETPDSRRVGTLKIDMTKGDFPHVSYYVKEKKKDPREDYTIGAGFKGAYKVNENFFNGEDEGARNARNIVGGMVSIAFAIPSGGSSLTTLGVLEIGLGSNEVLSGALNATEVMEIGNNIIKDFLFDKYGANGAVAFDLFNLS